MHKPRTSPAAALFVLFAACASGDVSEPGTSLPALKMSVTIRQARAKIPLRDRMVVRLKRKPFDIHFLARDFGPDVEQTDTLAVAARRTDITGEKLIGRRRVKTRAFVSGGEAAAHADRAQSWLILSPYAFASVYYQNADDRRADFVESWSDSVMELRFSVRELLIDDKDIRRPAKTVPPRNFPARIYCIFFMDIDRDGIIDANEILRVQLEFAPGR